MAGLFYVPGISSWITWIRSRDSLVSILGVNLGFLCFHLSSIWDFISDPLVSIWAPSGILSWITWIRSWSSYLTAAARSFSAPLTRRSFRHKRLNSYDCTLYAGSGKSPLSSGCFAIRRGPCRCSACQRHNTATASATCKPLSNRYLGIFRVGIFTTLKTVKAVIVSNLRVTHHVSS